MRTLPAFLVVPVLPAALYAQKKCTTGISCEDIFISADQAHLQVRLAPWRVRPSTR